jgi:hypothetical protein
LLTVFFIILSYDCSFSLPSSSSSTLTTILYPFYSFICIPHTFACLICTSCHSSPQPLWSSGQSSWLQILRPGFDSRHYQKKKRVVVLEQGPLSLVSTTEELLDRKVAAPI